MVDLLAGGRAKPLWVEQHAHIAAEGGIGVGLGADSKSVGTPEIVMEIFANFSIQVFVSSLRPGFPAAMSGLVACKDVIEARL
jgi:hypothetical protein